MLYLEASSLRVLLLEVGLPSSGLGDFQICITEKGEGEEGRIPHVNISHKYS